MINKILNSKSWIGAILGLIFGILCFVGCQPEAPTYQVGELQSPTVGNYATLSSLETVVTDLHDLELGGSLIRYAKHINPITQEEELCLVVAIRGYNQLGTSVDCETHK